MFSRLTKNKRKFILVGVLVLMFLSMMVFANNVYAGETTWNTTSKLIKGGLKDPLATAIAMVVGFFAMLFTSAIGFLTTVLMEVLVNIAKFNDFSNVHAVVTGWSYVRDVCNMFFILILLVIAFSTILRIETYSAKRALPKLLIMAVLINFSRMIFGYLIDFSQIVTLTFTSQINGGFMADSFNIDSIGKLAKKVGDNTDQSISVWAVVAAIILNVIAVFTILVVVVIMLATLVLRIAMLWIYTILSPLVFLGFAFPGIQKYVGQIWEDFVKQLMIGPMLGFFLWLAISIGASESINTDNTMCAGLNNFFCDSDFQKYIIVIAILMGGLMTAQKMGGTIGSLAGRGMSWVKKGTGFLTGGAALAGFWAGRKLDTVQMGIQKKIASRFGAKNFQPISANYRMIAEGFKRQRVKAMRDYESGKAGVWHDMFSRTLDFKYQPKQQREAAERRIKLSEKEIKELEADIKRDQASLKTITDEKEREEKLNEIKEKQERVQKLEIAIKRDKAMTKKLVFPKSKESLKAKNAAIREYHNEIASEGLSEEQLVDAFINETNRDKKRAYFQHLVDINGVNTLFDSLKINMDNKGIQDFLKREFGDEAADVAADMSDRAEAAGNYKLIGHAKFDLATGRNELATEEEQIEAKRIKQKEKFGQDFARKIHNDDLVDRIYGKKPQLSRGGVDTLITIAKDKGKFDQIAKGSYQERFVDTVLDLQDQIEERIKTFKAEGRHEDAEYLSRSLNAFKEYKKR